MPWLGKHPLVETAYMLLSNSHACIQENELRPNTTGGPVARELMTNKTRVE